MDFKGFKENYQKKRPVEYPSRVNDTPKLSVVLITYQHANFIIDCIESILAQKTTFPFEIIIGEDDSDDGTREICIEYANKNPEKIRLFLHHRENQIKILETPTGNFSAFYNFFSTRGNYIAFCEGDDMWNDPLKLQKQYDFLDQNPAYVFCYHSYKTVNYSEDPVENPEEDSQPLWDIEREDLSAGTYHPLLLTMCFKNVFKEVPKEIFEVLNVDTFLLSLLGSYGKAKYLTKIAPSIYRQHVGGIWSHKIKEKKFYSKINTYRKLRKYYFQIGNKEMAKVFKLKITNTYKMLILLFIKRGKYFNALKIMKNYLKYKLSTKN